MFGYKIAALALLAAGAAAQNLPSCASDCVGSNYAGCSQFDVTCICSSSQWISGLACCVSKSCNQADQDATIQYANKICAGVGITTLPQTATCSSTAGSAPAASSTGAPASASASPATTTAVVPPVGASGVAGGSGVAGSGGALTSPATSSGTGSPTGGSSIALSGGQTPTSSSARTGQSGAANKAGSVGMGAIIAGLAVAAL